MSKLYRLVIFDWEGTLGDTLGQVFHHIATEAPRLGLGEFNEAIARQFIDLGFTNMLKKSFPQIDDNQLDQLLIAVNRALATRPADVFLMPGVKELVAQLQEAEIDTAIATNKGQQSLLRSLQATGLESFFKVTRSAGQTEPKPCPQMLEEILTEFGNIPPSQALMVGDSITDIEMAKNLQVDAVGMDFYHHQKDALLAAGALAVFDNYAALAEYLHLNNSRELR